MLRAAWSPGDHNLNAQYTGFHAASFLHWIYGHMYDLPHAGDDPIRLRQVSLQLGLLNSICYPALLGCWVPPLGWP